MWTGKGGIVKEEFKNYPCEIDTALCTKLAGRLVPTDLSAAECADLGNLVPGTWIWCTYHCATLR